MKSGLFHKLKFLPAILLAGLVFGGLNNSNPRAGETEELTVQIRHLYDPTLYDVDSIEIFINLGANFKEDQKITKEVYIPERITNFLQEHLPKERNIPINFYPFPWRKELPDYCEQKGRWKDEVFTKPPMQGRGKLFILIKLEGWVPYMYEYDGVLSEVTTCLEEIGRVRLNFPENWSEIYPDAPVKFGDCTPPYFGWEDLPLEQKLEDAFCKIKADLFYIAWGISQREKAK